MPAMRNVGWRIPRSALTRKKNEVSEVSTKKRVLAACTGKTEQEQTTCVSEKAGVRNPRLAGLLLRFVG